ncbi:YopX protein [uncultured Caudovirales phage]|uniref:YopX protein n=1 Tax=uncultured Caudovirales phage TaxID=2100421 RepID=A0A6J5QRK4_9CAUD|nr:YopX protein [uncultured Caudovirales phage]
MKREIKFKAKDYKGKWQIGTYYYGVMYPTSFRGHYINDEQIDEKTLCQFTGIKDRNGEGVEVFEGDKIGRTSFWDKEIIWDKCGFYTISVNNPERKFPLTHLDEFDVVIGNIHDVDAEDETS